MNKEIFGYHRSDDILIDGLDTLLGFAVFNDSGEKIKTISFKFTLSGTSTFKAYFRYFNGRSWLDWQLLKYNDDNLTTIFGSSTNYPSTSILNFNILLAAFFLEGMKGGQIKIVRDSGSGDIDFDEGYAIVE